MNKSKGFTLIELLVVIAIIGILSSVVLASLNSARQKARDARRISDLKQIQLALEMYYDDTTTYAATIAALATGNYLPVAPTDPSTSAAYSYSTTGTTYCLGANLEGTNIPDNNDATCVTSLGGTVDYAVAP